MVKDTTLKEKLMTDILMAYAEGNKKQVKILILVYRKQVHTAFWDDVRQVLSKKEFEDFVEFHNN